MSTRTVQVMTAPKATGLRAGLGCTSFRVESKRWANRLVLNPDIIPRWREGAERNFLPK